MAQPPAPAAEKRLVDVTHLSEEQRNALVGPVVPASRPVTPHPTSGK